MREIKFRQAVYLNDKFNHWHYWGFINNGFVAPETGISTIEEALQNSCQYTGLTDIRDVEIYEGNIVKVLRFDSLPQYTSAVYYDGGAFCTDCEHPLVNKAEAIYHWPLEIIGNVYENEDLLT
jgi:hypothetical protein